MHINPGPDDNKCDYFNDQWSHFQRIGDKMEMRYSFGLTKHSISIIRYVLSKRAKLGMTREFNFGKSISSNGALNRLIRFTVELSSSPSRWQSLFIVIWRVIVTDRTTRLQTIQQSHRLPTKVSPFISNSDLQLNCLLRNQ